MMSTSEAATKEAPTVAAVVVNYNGGDRLFNTLQALIDQPFPLVSIAMLDSGSTDDSVAQTRQRFSSVTAIPLGENLGPCRSRNAGVAAADADLVLLLDSDVYVDAHTIGHLVAAHCETGAAVVCPRVRLVPERHIVQAQGGDAHFVAAIRLRHGWREAVEVPREREQVQTAISACLLVDRRVYQQVGGFDELLFFYFEDLEFGLRVRLLGFDVVCEPHAEVFHERGVGTPGLSFRGKERKYPARRGYYQSRNRLIVIATHYRLWTVLVLLPGLVVYELASVGMALMKGYFGRWIAAWFWMLTNSRTLYERRRAIQARRKRPDRELVSGGPLPLAPDTHASGVAHLIAVSLNAVLVGYWAIARRLIA